MKLSALERPWLFYEFIFILRNYCMLCHCSCSSSSCFGLNGPLRQYFSLYQAVSQREGERREN